MKTLRVLALEMLFACVASCSPYIYTLTLAFTDVVDQGTGSNPNPFAGNSILQMTMEVPSANPFATGSNGRSYNVTSFSARIDGSPIFAAEAAISLLDPHNSVTNWAGLLMGISNIFNSGDALTIGLEGPPLYFGGPLSGYGLHTGSFHLTEIAGAVPIAYRDNLSPTSCCVYARLDGVALLTVVDTGSVPEPSSLLLAGLGIAILLVRRASR